MEVKVTSTLTQFLRKTIWSIFLGNNMQFLSYRICRNTHSGRLIFRSNKRNSKTHQNPSVLVYSPLRKVTFSRPLHPKRLDQKSESSVLYKPGQKGALVTFCLRLSISRSGKSHVDPATQLHPIPKTMSFWDSFYLRFLGNLTKQQQRQIFSATFSINFMKKHDFKIFDQILMDGWF